MIKNNKYYLAIIIGLIIAIPISGSEYEAIYKILLYVSAGVGVATILKFAGKISLWQGFILMTLILGINVLIISGYSMKESKIMSELSRLDENIPEGVLQGRWLDEGHEIELLINNEEDVFISDAVEKKIEHTLMFYPDKIVIEGYLDDDYKIQLLELDQGNLKAINLQTKEEYNFILQ